MVSGPLSLPVISIRLGASRPRSLLLCPSTLTAASTRLRITAAQPGLESQNHFLATCSVHLPVLLDRERRLASHGLAIGLMAALGGNSIVEWKA